MAVFRVEKNKNYTTIANYHMRDKSLSLKAKGLLTLMLTLPDTWDYSLKGLCTLSKDGLDSVTAGVKELEKHGYLVRKRVRNEKGHLTNTEYIVYEYPRKNNENNTKNITDMDTPILEESTLEQPTLEQPTLEQPKLENPRLENPIQLNTKELNTKELNTKELNTKELNTKELNTNQSNHILKGDDERKDRLSANELYIKYKSIVDKNIEYEHFMSNTTQGELVGGIRDLMLEVLCGSKEVINIAGDEFPAELVKSRYLKITYMHIEYILKCLDENTTQIKNMKKYLMATLYNAPSTINQYYKSLYNYHQNN